MRLDKWKLRASSLGYIFNVKINVSVNTQFDDNKHMTRKSTLKLNEQQSLFTFNCCSLFLRERFLKKSSSKHKNNNRNYSLLQEMMLRHKWIQKNNNPQNSLTLELKRELNTLVRWSNRQDQKKFKVHTISRIFRYFAKKISKNTVWIQLRTIQTYF